MVEALIPIRVGSTETLNFMKTVKEEFCKIKGVKDIYGVFGCYGLVVRVETRTLEELGRLVIECIRGIKGVEFSETLVMGFQKRQHEKLETESKTPFFLCKGH